MKLKYAEALASCRKHRPCPSGQFAAGSVVAFRFLNNPTTEADFKPKDESRRDCVALGLSFWATLEQAQRKYRSLAASNNDDGETARQRLGDHIGEITLLPSDGVMDQPNAKGHITLHQFDTAEFADRVTDYVRPDYLVEIEQKKNAS